jgi:hypothetical protein
MGIRFGMTSGVSFGASIATAPEWSGLLSVICQASGIRMISPAEKMSILGARRRSAGGQHCEIAFDRFDVRTTVRVRRKHLHETTTTQSHATSLYYQSRFVRLCEHQK